MKKLKEQKLLAGPPRPPKPPTSAERVTALHLRVLSLFEPLAVWNMSTHLPSTPVWGRHPDRMDVLMALTALRLECGRVKEALQTHGPRPWPALKKLPLPKRLESTGLFGDEPAPATLKAVCDEMNRLLTALEPLVLEATRKPPTPVEGDGFAALPVPPDLLRRKA